MTKKERIYNLINGSVINELVEQVMEIDIEHPYGISKLKGAYVLIFKNNKRKPYIGSTIDISGRLVQHRNTTKPTIEHVMFLITKDKEDALLIEDFLIRKLDCSNKINAMCHITVQDYKKSFEPRIWLNADYMTDADFLPGDDVLVIYDKNRIIITKEVKGVTI